MKKNKDTTKALEAVETLIKYCDRYKHCHGCIFYNPRGAGSCKLNWVHRWEADE